MKATKPENTKDLYLTTASENLLSSIDNQNPQPDQEQDLKDLQDKLQQVRSKILLKKRNLMKQVFDISFDK